MSRMAAVAFLRGKFPLPEYSLPPKMAAIAMAKVNNTPVLSFDATLSETMNNMKLKALKAPISASDIIM